jgi:predicted membrane protein
MKQNSALLLIIAGIWISTIIVLIQMSFLYWWIIFIAFGLSAGLMQMDQKREKLYYIQERAKNT